LCLVVSLSPFLQVPGQARHPLFPEILEPNAATVQRPARARDGIVCASMSKLNQLEPKVLTRPSETWDGTIKTDKTSRRNSHTIVREFFSVRELKELTGISDWTWREWADCGKCASVKIGHRLLIPVSEVQRLLSEGLRPALKKNAEGGL
jgi:hypothetical protein